MASTPSASASTTRAKVAASSTAEDARAKMPSGQSELSLEHELVVHPAVEQAIPEPVLLAGLERAVTGGASKAGQVEHLLPGTHYELVGGDRVLAARTVFHGKPSVGGENQRLEKVGILECWEINRSEIRNGFILRRKLCYHYGYHWTPSPY